MDPHCWSRSEPRHLGSVWETFLCGNSFGFGSRCFSDSFFKKIFLVCFQAVNSDSFFFKGDAPTPIFFFFVLCFFYFLLEVVSSRINFQCECDLSNSFLWNYGTFVFRNRYFHFNFSFMIRVKSDSTCRTLHFPRGAPDAEAKCWADIKFQSKPVRGGEQRAVESGPRYLEHDASGYG